MKVTRLTLNGYNTIDVSSLSAKAQAELIVLLASCRSIDSTCEKIADEFQSAYYGRPLEVALKTIDVEVHADFDAAKAHLKSVAEVVEKATALAEAA
jgi:endonuclease V-like protein UPF0215 family